MDAVRIMALMVASVEGKHASPVPSDDRTRQTTLRELHALAANIPAALLGRPEAFPTLGYIVSVLLRVLTTSASSPAHRLLAGETVLGLLRRCPRDQFIVTVVPGVLTAFLKLLPGWEREPLALMQSLLPALEILLTRGYERIRADGKLETVLAKLGGLCRSMQRSSLLGDLLLQVLLNTQARAGDELSQKAHLDIISGLALLAADHPERVSLIRSRFAQSPQQPQRVLPQQLYMDRLQELVEQIGAEIDFRRQPSSSREGLWEETKGILQILPHHLWPSVAPLLHSSRSIAAQCLRNCQAPKGPVDLASFGWTFVADGPVAASLVECLGEQQMRPDWVFSPADLNAADLLVYGRLCRGQRRRSPEDADAQLDCLLEAYDCFAGRDIDPLQSIALLAQEEELWLLSWCGATFYSQSQSQAQFQTQAQAQVQVRAPSALDRRALLKPLLALQSAPSFAVQEAATQVLYSLAQSSALDSPSALLQSHGAVLLDEIASDLRFPLLFPSAPVQLRQLLRSHSRVPLPAAKLAAVVRDLEDAAADQQQLGPGYIYALLDCFATIIETAMGASSTRLPERAPPLSEAGERLEPILTLEQQLTAAIIRTTVHFVADDQDRIRLRALAVLAASVAVFVGEGDSRDAFLPLAHLTWSPLLARCAADPNAQVAQTAFQVITAQTRVAGSFLRNRLQRELFPLLGGLLARIPQRLEGVRLWLEMLQNMGQAGARVIRSAVPAILQLCVRKDVAATDGLTVEVAAQLLCALADMDADQMWFILVGQYGAGREQTGVSHPTRSDVLPTIDLQDYQDSAAELGSLQMAAIHRACSLLGWSVRASR